MITLIFLASLSGFQIRFFPVNLLSLVSLVRLLIPLEMMDRLKMTLNSRKLLVSCSLRLRSLRNRFPSLVSPLKIIKLIILPTLKSLVSPLEMMELIMITVIKLLNSLTLNLRMGDGKVSAIGIQRFLRKVLVRQQSISKSMVLRF